MADLLTLCVAGLLLSTSFHTILGRSDQSDDGRARQHFAVPHSGELADSAKLAEDFGSVATLSLDQSSKQPTNVKLFGLNDVLGPIMQIPYNSPALMSAMESLRVGYLRHPGGTVANYWNITSGRYATTCSHSSVCNYSVAVDKFPEGTFSPANFVQYLTSKTGAKLPVFDLNVLTMTEDTFDMQVDTLTPFCSSQECYVEIGNEIYITHDYGWRFPTADAYMKTGEEMVNKLRQKFPKVKISVAAGGIASFIPSELSAAIGYHQTAREREEALSWAATLAKYRHLFDAVTIHDYRSIQYAKSGDNNTRTSAIATWPGLAYEKCVAFCKHLYGDAITILITEYNQGLAKAGEFGQYGGPHALNMLSHVISGVQHGATIQSMQYHALLSVDGVGWDFPQGMIRLTSFNATTVSIDAISQVFAHIAAVGSDSDYMYAVIVSGGSRTPSTLPKELRNASCLQAAAFTSSAQQSMAIVNRCSEPLSFQIQHAETGVVLPLQALDIVTYDCGPGQVGGWVDMPSANASFPWPAPLTSSKPTSATLAPFSLSIVHMPAE